MTELLSREKEFLKLNEELNKINATLDHSAQQQQQAPSNSLGGSSNNNNNTHKTEQKFNTYTKFKGHSTLLRKRGAGDGGGGGAPNGNLNSSAHSAQIDLRPYSSQSSSAKECTKTATFTRHPGTQTSRLSKAPQYSKAGHSPPHCSQQRSDEDNQTPPSEGMQRSPPAKDANASTVSPTHRSRAQHQPQTSSKNVVEHHPQRSARSYTQRNIPTQNSSRVNTNTFTVKYRNPKFVASPSLEVLIKDEGASIRSSHTPTEVDSSISANLSGQTYVSGRGALATTMRKPISTEGLIKFLKSKITILEEDHDRISTEMTQQKELLEKTLDRHKKVEKQRDQAHAKQSAINDQLTKVESQLDETNRRLKERTLEHSSTQKELETVRREVKVLTQTNINLEKRLYRANEDLENTKNALTLMKNSDREMRETVRTENDSKDKQIKSLKKQRADLLNAYKKQLFLIDNLKRQNVCMEQAKIIGFGEKEFTKVLDWNNKG